MGARALKAGERLGDSERERARGWRARKGLLLGAELVAKQVCEYVLSLFSSIFCKLFLAVFFILIF